MQKNEVLYVQAQSSAKKFADVCSLLRTIASVGGAVWSVKFIVDGVVQMSSQHPDSISAISRVVEAFRLHDVVWAIISAVLGAAWFLERNGKKRAISMLGEYRRKSESGDEYRSSSSLGSSGGSPKGFNNAD